MTTLLDMKRRYTWLGLLVVAALALIFSYSWWGRTARSDKNLVLTLRGPRVTFCGLVTFAGMFVFCTFATTVTAYYLRTGVLFEPVSSSFDVPPFRKQGPGQGPAPCF